MIVAPVVPAPVVPLASAHSPKQRRISFFAKSGGIFRCMQREQHKTHKRRIKMSRGIKY
ncbi:MAG: hypothetical protein N2V73_07705 [Candidatus Methanospirare jalkutatii]|nr:hypothetical protein [Candidatus Methanospirare jalkutatii]